MMPNTNTLLRTVALMLTSCVKKRRLHPEMQDWTAQGVLQGNFSHMRQTNEQSSYFNLTNFSCNI